MGGGRQPGPGPAGWSVRRLVLTDTTRTTADAPGRVLPTDLYVPDGPGPFPVVVHAHGWEGSAAKFSRLLGTWAAAGVVVAAPDFPLTGDRTPPGERRLEDWAEQPADVAFVLDRVLELACPGGPLDGRLAAERVGLSGLSLGGATTYPLLFHDRWRDPRVRAAVLMSALELPLEGGEYDWSRRLPTLVFSGTADTSVSHDLQRSVVEKLAGPLWWVTLEGGAHATPFEDPESPHDDVVLGATVDFWAATLHDQPAAAARLVERATVAGVSSVHVVA